MILIKINVNRIHELTSLLDKDKKYMQKFLESSELLELKKKELEEVRMKLNQDLEDKKIKITRINLEKHELSIKITELEKTIEDLNGRIKSNQTEYIDYNTQMKIVKEILNEKEENILMLQNELETWQSELYRERIAHYNALQNVSALEYRLQTIRRDK